MGSRKLNQANIKHKSLHHQLKQNPIVLPYSYRVPCQAYFGFSDSETCYQCVPRNVPLPPSMNSMSEMAPHRGDVTNPGDSFLPRGRGGTCCLVADDLYLKPTAEPQGLRFCLEDGLEKMVCFGNRSELWQNHLITNTLKAQNSGKQHLLHIHAIKKYQRSIFTLTAEHAEVTRFSILTNEHRSVQWDFYIQINISSCRNWSNKVHPKSHGSKPHGPSFSIMDAIYGNIYIPSIYAQC